MNWEVKEGYVGVYEEVVSRRTNTVSDERYLKDIKNGKIDRSNFDANIRFLKVAAGLLKKDIRILEVGCGAGRLTNYLTQKRFDCIGLDISRNLIKEGRARYPNATIFIASGGGGDMPFKDASFDIVLSFAVLEHIPNTNAHLSEVRRILKPGGFYLFGIPNKIIDMPYEIIENRSFTKHKTYHCSLQSFWSLKKLRTVNNFGFRFVKIPVMSEYMEQKIEKTFGRIGVYIIIKMTNPDRLPIWLRPNFYVCAEKKWNK